MSIETWKLTGLQESIYNVLAQVGVTYSKVWDGMTNVIHDEVNAHGLLVENQNGEQWIAYGDKQYFSTPNRINRLKRYALLTC